MYFYWIGHGYITNVTQRQLLYTDTTENTFAFNLTSFIESLKTDTFGNFNEQIVFVDACAVYASQKSKKIFIGENLKNGNFLESLVKDIVSKIKIVNSSRNEKTSRRN